MTETSRIFPERLEDALLTARMNGKELSERTGISQGIISRWRKGDGALPKGEYLVMLCDALAVTPDYLLGYTDVPNNNVADAKAIKIAEAYTGLPRQALETLHRNEAYPFTPPLLPQR